MIREELIFELSNKGKKGYLLPLLDVPEKANALEGIPVRREIEGLPQVSEVEVVRHFTRLSKTNFCLDEGFYPLGSCTMKYNPKINEKIAAMPSWQNTHPMTPDADAQGCLKIFKITEELLKEITAMEAFTFQPSAGAQGELVGMMAVSYTHLTLPTKRIV